MLNKLGVVLVLVMAVLQGFYGLFAFIDPSAFSQVRGTLLADSGDTDWVQIYASRTLFIAILIAFLLYWRQYKVLIVAAVAGCVMPITDAGLAYAADAPIQVVAKHIATVAYLLFTAIVLRICLVRSQSQVKRDSL